MLKVEGARALVTHAQLATPLDCYCMRHAWLRRRDFDSFCKL